jgi:hypothetical protein
MLLVRHPPRFCVLLLGKQPTTTDLYKKGEADLFKLARTMQDQLVWRRVSSPDQVCYACQWVEDTLYIFAMSKDMTNGKGYFCLTRIFADSLRNMAGRWSVIRACLALRFLIEDQIKNQRQYRKLEHDLGAVTPDPSRKGVRSFSPPLFFI